MSLKNILIPHKERAAVAVSGGSDSLALALLLKDNIKDLTALIVDHQLRPESTQEALNVQKQLLDFGIKTHIIPLEKETFYTKTELKGDLQKRARSKRYEVLHKWCLDNQCKDLFLGHHKDDQKETRLMRLRQNSGLLGMGGIRHTSHFQGITLHRPLLGYTKRQLEGYLEARHILWIQDPSNKNEKFERIFWRQYLAKNSFPLKKDTLFEKVRTAFDGWITRFLNQHAHQSPLGYLSLDYNVFLKLPLEFQKALLSYSLVKYGVGEHPPSNKALLKLSKGLSSEQVCPQTLKGCRISLKQGCIIVAREYKCVTKEPTHTTTPHLFDGRFLCHIPDNKLERAIIPMGEENWRNLVKENPFLKDHRAPRYALWSLPILKKNNELCLPSCLLDDAQNKQGNTQQKSTLKTFSCTFIGKSPF